MTPNRLGILIGASFGLVFVMVNARALPPPVGLSLQVLGLVAFAGLLVALFRGTEPIAGERPEPPGFGRGYWMVVAAQVAAFFGGNLLLNGPLDLPQGVLPWITFVVGAHFLGLAKVWNEPSLGWLGTGMAALGALGLGLAVSGASDATIAVVAGVCPGALLLAGSWWAVATSPAAQQPRRRTPRSLRGSGR